MKGKRSGIKTVLQVLILQLILGVICLGVTLMLKHDLVNALSSVFGSVISLVPMLVYGSIAFHDGLINRPTNALKNHKLAMVARFIVTAMLFATVCVYFRECNFLVLFVAYIVGLTAYWLSLVLNY